MAGAIALPDHEEATSVAADWSSSQPRCLYGCAAPADETTFLCHECRKFEQRETLSDIGTWLN